MMRFMKWAALLTVAVVLGCEGCKEPIPEPVPAEFYFPNDITAFESAMNASFDFEVRLPEAASEPASVDYETIGLSATAGEDFESVSGTLTFEVGETTKTISVPIVVDEYLEGDEQFQVILSNPINGYLRNYEQVATGTIRNDDSAVGIGDAGYEAADSYDGMQLVWSDEFDGNEINNSNWTYDLGANGWGNQELQNYVASEDNAYVQDGKLIIKAVSSGSDNYTSARLKSIDLQEFEYGRVDVRAVLPVGQGIWPAIWMLGANYSEIGWPDCGEIDIMELIGNQPNRVHGTAHWGNDPSAHQYLGSSIALPSGSTFDEEFHVFSIEWQEDEIRWFMDDQEYFSLAPGSVAPQNWPFNQSFFFILNVAVGGIWPGYPDETTLFPAFMAVDYVRVYQAD